MKYKINLLSEKKESPVDRIIYFSLNYLKYILVVTQIVVIFVFFYKFKVDQEIIDLKEAVDQKKEIIEISQSLLKEAETAEIKITNIKPILQKQSILLDQLNYVLSIFPEQIFLTKFNINDNKITLIGFGPDPRIVHQFYSKLQKDKRFKQINLISLKKTNIGYEFNLILGQFKI